jgi:APA family basic amino acid/polyamine antiporter
MATKRAPCLFRCARLVRYLAGMDDATLTELEVRKISEMHLKPVLGPVQLIFYSVGVIIGAGVYSVLGAAAGLAQHDLWISFLLGAGIALLTAISYAEMATSFPAAGAEYIYIRRAWPKADWLAFGVGAIILIGGAATAATVALAFGGYLRVFVDWPAPVAAVLLLAGCNAFNTWGLRESSWVNILFTSIEVAGLLLVILVALTSEARTPAAEAFVEPSVMAAAALLFFVYLGFEEIANLAEEVRNPGRDLPIALFVSLAITTGLYVAVSVAVFSLAAPSELAASEAPLAAAIQKAWPGAANVLSGIALFATANTVLITVIATSRVAFSMARDKEISSVFARLLPVRQTPWVAAILTFAMAAVLVPIGSVKILAELSSFAALVAFFTVNVVLIALRYKMPGHMRPFRAPGAIGRVPVLPILAIVSIVFLLIHFEWQIYAAGGVALAASALAFGIRQWFRRTRH